MVELHLVGLAVVLGLGIVVAHREDLLLFIIGLELITVGLVL